MGLLENTFKIITSGVSSLFQLQKAHKSSCAVAETIQPIYTQMYQGEKYLIACPNNLVRYRAETYFTKEPETIEWLDTLKKDDILFDIGANIGLYSIYAAKKGIKVYAFEPDSQNYGLLHKNIYLNQLSEKISCLNVAFADENKLDYLFIPKFQVGGALNNFGENKDWQHNEFSPDFKQAVLGFTLDRFFELYPQTFPTHIKLDVDGIEGKIIKGASETLKNPKLKSLIIEINENLAEDVACIKLLEEAGLKVLHKKRSPMIEQNYKNIPVYNFVFIRE